MNAVREMESFVTVTNWELTKTSLKIKGIHFLIRYILEPQNPSVLDLRCFDLSETVLTGLILSNPIELPI